MATLSREASVTYGGFTVGGDQASHILRDIMVTDDGYETSVVEFTFTVQQETVALFSADCAAAEAAFRIPHQNLTVAGLGSKSFSQSGRTGFNAVPTINKFGHPSDSGLARTYRVRIEVGRPADNSSSSGRRVTRTSINVDYNPARRRTVTISGEWTGLTSVTARAQYEAQIATYAATVLADLGGTYKILNEPQTTSDDANNVIRSSITYEEIIFTSVGGSDSEVRAESVVITRSESQPGDTPVNGFVTRVATLTCQYDAYVVKTSTDIRGKWLTLRSRIISMIQTTYGTGSVVVVSEDPRFDYTDNRITATVTCLGIPGNLVVECRASTEHDIDFPVVLTPIWDGDPFSRYSFKGIASEIRTVHITQRVVGTFFGIQGAPLEFPDQFASNGELILKKRTTNATPENAGGTRQGPFQAMTTITETRVYERARVRRGVAPTPTPSGSAFAGGTVPPGGGRPQ